jgi:TrmH family RNA methyltransferase
LKIVESRANRHFQELRRLVSSASGRRASGLAFIEGVHLCRAYLEHGQRPRSVVCAQSALSHPEVAALTDEARAEDVVLLADALFASLSPLEKAPGVAFVIEIPEVSGVRIAASAVLLDRLQDPGNLGSILRSAAAAGVTTIVCSRGTVDAWSPKALRAGMGAQFGLSIGEDRNLLEVLEGSSVAAVATSSHAPSSVFEADLRRDIAWLFGNEGQGVDATLERRCEHLAIPQPGGEESLNVAAAAAICLFEQVRQRSN